MNKFIQHLKTYFIKNKTFHIVFITLTIAIAFLIFKTDQWSVNKEIENRNKLENNENIKINPTNKTNISAYFISLYWKYYDFLSALENNQNTSDFESQTELMLMWDSQNDSEFVALKNDIMIYANEYPDDTELKGYSEDFNSAGMKPIVTIDQLEIYRKKSIEATIKVECERGSIPGGFSKNFVKGFVSNFIFTESETRKKMTNSITGEGTTDLYIYSGAGSFLHFVFSLAFAFGLLLPWYLIFTLIRSVTNRRKK